MAIAFETIVESVVKQLPQVDLTLSIGDVAAAIAHVVLVYRFYISRTLASLKGSIRSGR